MNTWIIIKECKTIKLNLSMQITPDQTTDGSTSGQREVFCHVFSLIRDVKRAFFSIY